MTRTNYLMLGLLGAIVGTLGCEPDASTVADASLDGGLPTDDGSVDGGRSVASWCGEPDDLPCCEGSPSFLTVVTTEVPFVPPLFEPVRPVDDATRAFIDAGGLDVAALWRGVTDSGDPERPSRVTLETTAFGPLVFDFARAVASFPALADGAALMLSAAAPASPYPPDYNRGRAVRLARPDGSLLAAAGVGCDWDGGPPMPALFAPLSGTTGGGAVCREPAPVPSGGVWCYVGRTNYAVALDGVAAPVAPGDTARVDLGGANYDFTNYRFAFQDTGGPHVGGTCLPGIQAFCSFSAYAVE